MKEELLKIDDVAKQSGLSKRTIRYYEEIGILQPPERSEGGTRLYHQDHVEFLKKITVAKEVLGLTLQEVQQFITLTDTIESQRAEYRKASAPGEQREMLAEMIGILDKQLELLEQKMGKILNVQTELVTLRERARAAIERIDHK
ncbi:MerR family transcriptional regulator [Neobacillus muris]|uniref:MerR family transcriptional regulator n=1 Tax=Neobacillus muris TaxID=2941334 RepID=UPI002040E53E|nr:MerR family transcriptional regulator [Neobacillus muris]